jgi:hypothetical protein
MTNNEYEIIRKAREILDKLTDDETIKSVDNYYWCYLHEAYDGITMLVSYISDNREKLVKAL